MSVEAYVVAVHGGAGFHGAQREKEIKRAMRRACVAGLSVATNSGEASSEVSSQAGSTAGLSNSRSFTTSLSMVESAICVLEDEEHLNAGYGSNLTIDGSVECDASIMCAAGRHFGSVGAVSGIKNPIRVAKAILLNSLVPSRFGRVAPMILVSGGAHQFAANAGNIEFVPRDMLISPSAQALWSKWKTRLAAPEDNVIVSPEDDNDMSLQDIQDTVGAVAFHPVAGMAAGVSSGGLLMKSSGRVGEAAVFGAGCWASQTQVSSGFEGMACSVSGTGEDIIRENFAARLGDAFSSSESASRGRADKDPHEILDRVLCEYWESCRKRGVEDPAVGVLLLVTESETSVRLWCGFTTSSMAVGFASSEKEKPKALILRHPNYKARKSDRPQIYITSMPIA